ncbi:MAG: hypothetical protein V4469_04515 [Patescibacteria group bacterium]
MALKNTKEERTFASVLADGKIHVTVPEGTPGSVVRTYETSDKKKGSKTEMVYTELIGKVSKIGFFEGDFGMQLQVTVDDGKNKPVVLSLSTSSNYGEDMMKKLINVDQNKFVKIAPYSFTDDNGKMKKGITIWQKNDKTGKNEKLQNYFYDAEAKENIHGYPEPKKLKGGKKLTKDQWKLYFGECREFLVEKITEHFKIEETQSSVSTADQDFEDMVNDAAEVMGEE